MTPSSDRAPAEANNSKSPEPFSAPAATHWLALAALTILGGWAYWPTLVRIWNTWESNPDYSHGYLVVPIAGAILWARRTTRPAERWQGIHWSGTILLIAAAALRIAAGRFYLPELDAWSIPLWVGGVVWLLGGWNWFRWSSPAIAFLWFATPLPGTLEILLSTPLQRLAANLSAMTLRMLGLGAIAEGTTILLGDQVLEVERACSGLRMFYSILALSFACVALTRPSKIKAAIILLSTGPIAIAANVVRITVTGILLKYLSGEAAHKFSHDFAGILMIPLAAAMLAGLVWFLSSVSKRYEQNVESANSWLLKCGVSAGIFAALLFGWNWLQRDRAYNSLLETANRHEAESEIREAIQYLNRYVSVRPQDTAALIRLAELFNGAAISRGEKLRAIQLQRDAWRKESSRQDLAVQAAATAVDIAEFETALDICEEIAGRQTTPEIAAKATQLRADALLGRMAGGGVKITANWADVDSALEKATELNPYEVRHMVARAEVIRDHLIDPDKAARIAQADALLERLIAEHPEKPHAWLARANYRRRYANEQADPAATILAADDDLAHAAELASEMTGAEAAEVLLHAARRNVELSKVELAVSQLNSAVKAAPEDFRSYLALAELHRRSGRSDAASEAIKVLEMAKETIKEGNFSLMLALASLKAEVGDVEEADKLLIPLEEMAPRVIGPQRGSALLTTGLVRAQLLAGADGPQAAIDVLRRLLESSEVQMVQRTQPTALAEAWGLLARAYLQTGSPDMASEAFERANQIAPDEGAWRDELAKAAARTGDLITAKTLYRQIATASPKSTESWLALAALELQMQSRAQASAQRWRDFDVALRQAKAAGANDLAIDLLRAQQAAAQGDLRKALDGLEALSKQLPEEPRVWRGLAVVRQQNGDLEGALAAANALKTLEKNSLESDALRAMLLVEQHHAEEALQLLSERFADAKAGDAARAGAALATLQLRTEQTAAAIETLEEAHRRAPEDVAVVDMLADLAWSSQDWSALEKYEKWLREIEGDGGSLWRLYRAQRLLANIQATTDPAFDEVVTIAESLVKARPRWAKSHFLQGEIAYRFKKNDAAIAAFERAWQCGGPNVLLADRLIDLLSQQGRFDEASAYVAQVGNFLSVSPQLFDRSIPFYSQNDGASEALRIAQDWLRRRPDDPLAHLRLARIQRMLAAADPTHREELVKQAEAANKRAIELAPGDVRPWISWVAFAAQSEGGREQALDLLHQFANQIEVEPLQRAYVLAQLYQALGMPAESQQFFREAVSLAKNAKNTNAAVNVLVGAAHFYVQTAPDLAERCARDALKLDEASAPAKEILLYALARQNDPKSMDEAFRLLEEVAPVSAADATAADRRLRAILLARRGKSGDVESAIELIDGILDKSVDDQVLLARLYEEAGRVGPAFDLIEQLASRPSPRPQDIAEFLRFWQTHFIASESEDDQSAADQFAGRAHEIYAKLTGSPSLIAARLQWKLREAKARGKSADLAAEAASEVVKSWLGASDVQASLSDSSGQQLLHEAILVLLNERAFDALFALVANPPQPIDAAAARVRLCHALIVVGADDSLQKLADPVIEDTVNLFGDKPDALQAVADYYFMIGRYQDASDQYRRVLALDPTRAQALNNFALALAEQSSQRHEAAAAVAQAIELAPTDSSFRDSQAVIELLNGRPRESVKILQELKSEQTTDPTIELHLAMAYDAMGDKREADEHMAQAIGLGVERSLLSLRDRSFLEKWRSEQASLARSSDPAPPVAVDGDDKK